MCSWYCAYVCACVRECVRVCVSECMRVCVCFRGYTLLSVRTLELRACVCVCGCFSVFLQSCGFVGVSVHA